jgi:DNA repair exonuclease SbcCD ATPase subunit
VSDLQPGLQPDNHRRVANLEARIEALKAAAQATEDSIRQTLAKALHYPRYCDDQEHFPGATEANGYFVGEHVAESLAAEASRRIAELERLNVALRADVDKGASQVAACGNCDGLFKRCLAYQQRIADKDVKIAALTAEKAALSDQIEADRTALADCITGIRKDLDGRFWLTEGRGFGSWPFMVECSAKTTR